MAFFFSWVMVRAAVNGAGCRTGAGPGFVIFLFCLHIIMKIKILKSKCPKLL